MFSNLTQPNQSYDEGTVIQVDPKHGICKVKTLRGQNLDRVVVLSPVGGAGRGGDRINPNLGDRVVINYSLGYPLIIGFLPSLQNEDLSFPLSIDGDSTLVDTGNYSPGGTAAFPDANKPKDLLAGDRVISSEGGAMLSLLRGGSAFLRSSRLSEIFLSKLDDVVKVVCRNWEHYTDVSSDIVKNILGRVYRYVGYSNSTDQTRIEDYKYHQYYGDTALAEALKTNYLVLPSSIPAKNNIVYKEQITGSGELMRRTLDLSGNEELWIKSGGAFTRQVSTGTQVTISYGDNNTITVNNPVIKLERSDGAIIVMTSNGINASFSGGVINMDNTGIQHTYSGHFVNIDSGGVHLG